jgi:hypothetical protein
MFRNRYPPGTLWWVLGTSKQTTRAAPLKTPSIVLTYLLTAKHTSKLREGRKEGRNVVSNTNDTNRVCFAYEK